MRLQATLKLVCDQTVVRVHLADIEIHDNKVTYPKLNSRYMTGYVSEFMNQVAFHAAYFEDRLINVAKFKLNGNTVKITRKAA